jgi:hypothetical protein
MARHYSTRSFFRNIPNALLARCFQERGLFREKDFSGMKETKPDELFTAWLEIPDDQRNEMDAEFQDIFELSCEKGFRAIMDEAEFHLPGDDLHSFAEKMSALSNHYERAMITFLEHKDFWRGAIRFYHADTLPYWRKRKNMSHRPAAVDEESIKQFAEMIRKYFHHTEGRGNNCVVEPLRRGELDYFFAYPEDYSQQSIEWVNGEFDRRPHNPAFEVIYVYSQQDGTLDLNYRGARKAIQPLQGIFATTILKLEELPPDPQDERIYNLAPLLKRNFDFTYDISSGIEKVTVRKLRLSSRVKKGERITLEADTSEKPDAVYDLLEEVNKALPTHMFTVTQVELSAIVSVDADKRPKTMTIRITYPNSCSLKYDEIGLKLRDMLEASGIEPKELEDISESDKPVNV